MKSGSKVNKTIVLGEVISKGNQPILYRREMMNKPESERQLQSIANAWHEGSIRSAILALESDLAHG